MRVSSAEESSAAPAAEQAIAALDNVEDCGSKQPSRAIMHESSCV